MLGTIIDFIGARRARNRSKLGQQIEATLCAGMTIPDAFELLFQWIEAHRYFVDTPNGRIGFLFPEAEMKQGWNDTGRPGGTDIEFFGEGNVNLKYWFETESPQVIERLCVFAKTGAEGSMAAFWLADDGTQKIVHLGSGSGSIMTCVLADDPIDFLRLLAIGYDQICWGDAFSEPPNAGGGFLVQPNHRYQAWVKSTFDVSIPERGSELVSASAVSASTNEQSADPFWNWVIKQIH
ncbi:hypothetical protein [Sphingobium phenoxybenzoativorans]|uniref:hypothetical protein n=1 Tax=Sphingobium phenoxybenzoativorans TaxID=1592790 RepID=UPI000872DE38|nr:hypothetical protein [Sphingobium phenoxybenzoativorans]